MNVEQLLATPEPMRAWLDTKHPNNIVGQPGWVSGCPIAHFLDESLGGRWVDVMPHAVFVGERIGCSTEYALPEWGMAFVTAVDQHNDRITAARARTILAAVTT